MNTTLQPSHLHRPFTLVSSKMENYRTRSLTFAEKLDCQPGQFVMAWLPGVGEKPFSIAGDDPLQLLVVDVGPVSHSLHAVAKGQRVWIRGPLGHGYRLVGQRVLLAAGGYGVAPLYYLARKALEAGMSAELCMGARSAEDVLWVERFQALDVPVRVMTEDGSAGGRGLVTQATEAAIAAAKPDSLCACGPLGMLEALDRQCERLGVARQLSWEAHMRCGMGLCGSCELPSPQGEDGSLRRHSCQQPGWLACLDGPVSWKE